MFSNCGNSRSSNVISYESNFIDVRAHCVRPFRQLIYLHECKARKLSFLVIFQLSSYDINELINLNT